VLVLSVRNGGRRFLVIKDDILLVLAAARPGGRERTVAFVFPSPDAAFIRAGDALRFVVPMGMPGAPAPRRRTSSFATCCPTSSRR
jgi:hypothetical protein